MLDQSVFHRIKDFALKSIGAKQAVGLSVGIVEGGNIVYCAGFGERALGTGWSVTEHTLFHTASVTKPFVATAIMQMVECGALTLTTPVVDILRYFELDDERYRQITIRHLLTHTSGLPNSDAEEVAFNAAFAHPEYDDAALERHVRSLMSTKLTAAPGERYGYSNFGYHILGAVISMIEKVDFAACIKQRVLEPVGMDTSVFDHRIIQDSLATIGHIAGDSSNTTVASNVYPYHRAFEPSCSLHSSAYELCLWAQAQLNKGCIDGKCVLGATAYHQMLHRYVPLSPERPEEGYRGLSWYLYDQFGRRVVAHHGGDIGFASLFQFFPDDNAAITVLANTDWSVFDPGPIVDMVCESWFSMA